MPKRRDCPETPKPATAPPATLTRRDAVVALASVAGGAAAGVAGALTNVAIGSRTSPRAVEISATLVAAPAQLSATIQVVTELPRGALRA